MMNDERIAKLVADTLNYALRQVEGIPALTNIEVDPHDSRTVLLLDTEGNPYALTVESI